MTPDSEAVSLGRSDYVRARGIDAGKAVAALLAILAWLVAGCSQEPGLSSIETDAHGYLCMQCGAKFYTGQRVFLESKCPKCQQDTLADVTAYWCEKDKHLTIRPRVPGPQGAAVCEKCEMPLKNAMVSPHEKDLKAWGATKTTPAKAR